MHRFATLYAVIVLLLIFSPQSMEARNLLGAMEKTNKASESSSSLSLAASVSGEDGGGNARVLDEKQFGNHRSLVSSIPSPDIGH